jgi:hypothetical protein
MRGFLKAALLGLRRIRKSLPIYLNLSCSRLLSANGIEKFQLLGLISGCIARCGAAAAFATEWDGYRPRDGQGDFAN